ncbi:hypothetical protein Hanom_Chr14g01298351 [Helianthus anomalus]
MILYMHFLTVFSLNHTYSLLSPLSLEPPLPPHKQHQRSTPHHLHTTTVNIRQELFFRQLVGEIQQR